MSSSAAAATSLRKALHRQGRHRRRRRLRLRRHPARPRQARQAQRDAGQRRVRQRHPGLLQHPRRARSTRAPYSNTDLGSGHGTHVAGIVAADSSSVTDGSRYGVAPGADLACFAIGQVLFTTAVVTAYDYMLDQPDLLGIDVVNNSWGNSYRQFDPRDPVAVATKAVADQGVTVVFAAGNSGAEDVSGQPEPVLAVPLGHLGRGRHARPAPRRLLLQRPGLRRLAGDRDRRRRAHDYTGDRIGLVHPDVTAPGVDISSTCDSAGTVIGPCPPGENTTASGHLDGLAARRRRRRGPEAGPARADPHPGAPGTRGHRHARSRARRPPRRCRSGRSATAT